MGLGEDTDTIGLIVLIVVVGVIFIAGKLQQRKPTPPVESLSRGNPGESCHDVQPEGDHHEPN